MTLFPRLNRVTFGDAMTTVHGTMFSMFYSGRRVSFHFGDAEHKRQRKLLNTVFSATNMRALVPIIYDISAEVRYVFVLSVYIGTNMHRKLADLCEHKMHNGEAQINMLDLSYRSAVESLGRAAFGYPFHSLDESKSNAYTNSVRNFLWVLFVQWYYECLDFSLVALA
jgi:hypothetical protein